MICMTHPVLHRHYFAPKKKKAEIPLPTGSESFTREQLAKLPDRHRAVYAIRRHLWSYYCEKCKRDPRVYQLTPARLDKAVLRLIECVKACGGDWGDAVGMFDTAIENLSASKYHMGQNDQKKKYNDWIDNLCKSAEQFQKWQDLT